MTISWMKEDICTYKGIISPLKEVNGRSPFLKDYGSIIYRSQFRRLSNKTQVFLNPSVDFPRTRLTHSIEVEQISKEISRCLVSLILEKFKMEDENSFAQNFEDLVCASCLAHDLGQAPFGHKGENTLFEIMKKITDINNPRDYFEANKQNVRILVGNDGRRPYGVSCALIDSIMKYKSSYFGQNDKHPNFYSHEAKIIENLNIQSTLNIRHPACYIMEAADDIAYISSDLQDALKLNLISSNTVEKLLKDIPFPEHTNNFELKSWSEVLDYCEEKKELTKITSFLIKSMLEVVKINLKDLFENIEKNENIENLPKRMNSYLHNADCDLNILYFESGRNFKRFKKSIYKDYILKDKEIGRNEFLAEKVITELWDVLCEHLINRDYTKSDIFKLIPDHVQRNIQRAHENNKHYQSQKYQYLADYISGMTDRYAVYLWSQLFNPTQLGFG